MSAPTNHECPNYGQAGQGFCHTLGTYEAFRFQVRYMIVAKFHLYGPCNSWEVA